MTSSSFSKSSEAEQQLLPPEQSKWPIWPWLVLLLALVLVMLIRASIAPSENPSGVRHAAVGARLTYFQLEPLTGDAQPVGLADLTAKATLVNFWGPWCSACVVEFPHLVELEQHFRSEPGFQFLSVSSNFNPYDEEGLLESTTQFLKEYRAEFPTYRDPQAATARALAKDAKIEDFGYPTTVLIGPGGVVRAVWSGYVEGDENSIRAAIEQALATNEN